MQLQILKQPHTISFANNPIAFVLAITPYRQAEQGMDLKIIIRIEVEDIFLSSYFSEASESVYYPMQDGSVTASIESVLKAFLKQFIPPPAQAIPVVTEEQVKRYKITYRLLKDNILVTDSVATSEIFFAIKGGLSYQEWHPKKYFTETLVNQKPFLRYAAKKELVFEDQKIYLSWLAQSKLNFTSSSVDNGDGTETYTFTFASFIQYSRTIFNISFIPTGIAINYRDFGSTGPWLGDFSGSAGSPRTITIPSGVYEFQFHVAGLNTDALLGQSFDVDQYVQGQTIKVIVGFSDGTQSDETTIGTVDALTQVCIMPAGFNQLVLSALTPSNKTALWYSLKVYNDVSTVCESQKFYLDFRNYYETKDLLFANSLGGIETIRLRGEIDAKTEYEKINADKVTMPAYFAAGILESENENIFSSELEVFKGDTGFLPKDVLDRLRDLFNSKFIFEIKNNRLIPILINAKSAEWFTNKQNLYSIAIDWQHSFQNENYTPSGTIATGGTCPAVETLIVVQSAKNKLSIAWALETGYAKVQVDINIDGEISSRVFKGNTGQQEVDFVNPAASGETHDITITARTICNDLIEPADVGPLKTVELTVNGNLPPVAVDDHYSLPKGIGSVLLPVSALANDYDPDEDAIAVVPAAGDTDQGGTYAIDVDGMITYTYPPPLVGFIKFRGVDSFQYTITETGLLPLTATATAYITVGNTSSGFGIVYIRLTLRNFSYGVHAGIRTNVGEIWLEFYSDAAGTTPVDITGVGLVITVSKTTTGGTGAGVVTTNYTGIGIDMKIFAGILSTQKNSNLQFITNIVWQVVPGSGYQAL